MCFEAAATMGASSSVIRLDSSFSFNESSTPPQFFISSCEIKSMSKSHNYNYEEEKGRCELVDYNSLPEFLKHNEYIINYYRSEWPLKQTMLSIFSLHNETLNIWTHVIGFFIFLILTCYAVSIFPVDGTSNSASVQLVAGNSSNTFILNFPSTTNVSISAHDKVSALQISRWPFYLYLVGAMFCLLMSSSCHLLSCHSARTCYLMLRLDYAGISTLIVSSFYPLVYYSFACDPFFRDLYLASITLFGVTAIAASLTPVFETPQFLPARAVLFACMAASGLIPIAHKMVAFGHRPEAVVTTGYEAVMGMFYGLGVLVYAFRIPERWLPGKFDLAGHSHQLFHVLVIAGAYTHYLSSLVYLGWRETEGC